ncbi:MAG: hypothetical protein ACLFPM_04790 [Candidatus Izemoplasmatales bacterium]
MKKIMILTLFFISLFMISSCRTIYRDYQDDELEVLAKREFAFDTYETFKIIDAHTAKYLTTKAYQNSGVIIGIKNGQYKMIFVPKKISENPFVLENTAYFNLQEIYDELRNFIDETMFLNDYGGLSIGVDPYLEILELHPSLTFDSQIFYMVTTDENIYYANYIKESLIIFNTEYQIIYS